MHCSAGVAFASAVAVGGAAHRQTSPLLHLVPELVVPSERTAAQVAPRSDRSSLAVPRDSDDSDPLQSNLPRSPWNSGGRIIFPQSKPWSSRGRKKEAR